MKVSIKISCTRRRLKNIKWLILLTYFQDKSRFLSILIDGKRGFVLPSALNNTNHESEQFGAVVTLYTCIREELGSNFGRETGYPDRRFSRFSESRHANCRILH
jgi:hypothetical protein